MKKLFFALLFLPFFAQAQIILTAAGNGTQGFSGDGGPATDAMLFSPRAVAFDDTGNLYICQNASVRKVSPAFGGIITTVVGGTTSGYSGDGGPAHGASVDGVHGVAIDHNGNLFLADAGNNRVRKVTTDGIINTIAGTGVAGYNGDGIPATAAQLNSPFNVVVDDTGNVYISDSYNYRIRKVDTFGIISTIIGTGINSYSADGVRADTTSINRTLGLCLDKNGQLYFTDSARIRTIDELGIVTTVAGIGSFGFSGDGGPAIAAQIIPGAIALDTAGNMYIAGGISHRIRKVNKEGVINTIAGTGAALYNGDGINPILANLNGPSGVAVNDVGDIYIGDMGNDRVRVVSNYLLSVADQVNNKYDRIEIYPNPVSQQCTINVSTKIAAYADILITNVEGKEVYRSTIKTNAPFRVTTDWAPGVYTIVATTPQTQLSQKIIVQ